MRKFSLLGLVVGIVMLAVPVAASANQAAGYTGTDCTWAANEGATNVGGAGAVYVYNGTAGSTGNPGTSATGACVNVNGFGGYAENGSGTQGSYTVVDGSNNNPDPGDGYVALSNYEDGTAHPCNSTGGTNGSTNGGGCLTFKGVGPVPPTKIADGPFACGNTSGDDFNSTTRDGCFIP
jgi:hypothetical protein